MSNTKELIVVDSRISLLNLSDASLLSSYEVLTIDAKKDGWTQLAKFLASKRNFAAIHVLAHGSAGSISLGSSDLNAAALTGQHKNLSAITSAMAPGGDLLLYGCNVAKGQVGQDFVKQLANATKVDVAASTDATGSTGFGGNWNLESQVGNVTTRGLNPAAFSGLLAANNAASGTVTLSGLLKENATLVAVAAIKDKDGLGQFSYQWFADGAAISDATSNKLLLTSSLIGKTLTVSTSFTDGMGNAEKISSKASAKVANVNDLPVGSVSIDGAADQFGVLKANVELTDADGLGALQYSWLANGKAIGGASKSTYTLTQSEVGKNITLQVSYKDGFGTVETVKSSTTDKVANVNDLVTGTATVKGTAIQGGTLTAVAVLADADGLGKLSYKWFANGNEISGANKATLILDQSLVGTKVNYSVSYTDGFGSNESMSSVATAAVANINDKAVGTVLISGNATQGETLTVSNTLSDADGLGEIKYQWFANGAAIAAATGDSLTLTQDQVGKTITAKAIYTDGAGTVETVTSAASKAVLNVNDVSSGSVTITGALAQGQTLTAVNTIADADGVGKISYTWLLDNVSVGTGATLKLTQSHVGKSIEVLASHTDGFKNLEKISSGVLGTITNVNDAATGTVSISGNLTQGSVLTASSKLVDLDGLGEIRYQWMANGLAIEGATEATLTLNQEQVGKAISVSANFTDALGALETLKSAPSKPVANVNDKVTGEILILGDATQGQTLTAVNQLADLDGMGLLAYQWYADELAIKGATLSTLSLDEAVVGKKISVKAGFTDKLGGKETATSLPTSAVENINDLPTGAVAITGNFTQGQTVSLLPTAIADKDGIGSFSYQWSADGQDISGATQKTFTLTRNQVGKKITASVLYTDGHGTQERVTSVESSKVSNLNALPTGSLSILGTVAQGQTLTLANAIADEDGLGPMSYQWNANGNAISGATGTSLSLTESLVGQSISVTASYVDAYGTSESVSSSATASVANVNDAATGSVTLSGVATQGQTLSAVNNITDPDGMGTVTYQWKADGVNISGANSNLFVLTENQVGKSVSVAAVYTDAHGTVESVSSTSTSAVANVNDSPTGSLSITGNLVIGSTLGVSSSVVDLDGLGAFSYQWYANSQAISGATAATYTLSDQSLLGKTLYLTASYTDGHGTSESMTSNTTSAVALANAIFPTGYTPSNSGTNVSLNTNLVVTFAENISLGTGTIQILTDSVNGTVFETFDVASSARLKISGNTLTIDPVGFLTRGKTYVAVFATGSVISANGGNPASIANLTFSTVTAGLTVTGTSSGSVLDGGGLADLITGGAGNDTIRTSAGEDVVIAGGGDDAINCVSSNGALGFYSNTGNKQIYAGDGNDSVEGSANDDYIEGGNGNDLILTENGNDVVLGGIGDDSVNGQLADPTSGAYSAYSASGDKNISGGDGQVFLYGATGNDSIAGDAGNDTLYGASGNDQLSGGSGNDFVYGGQGNDSLTGGAGYEVLDGGSGDDTYYINAISNKVVENAAMGTDTAIVNVNFVKLNDNVEVVKYAAGVQALPYWIDSLLFNSDAGLWSKAMLERTNGTFYYAFPSTLPSYYSGATNADYANGFQSWNTAQKSFARDVFSYISGIINIRFEDIASNGVDISGPNVMALMQNVQVNSGGYAVRSGDNDPRNNDFFFNYADYNQNPINYSAGTPGTYASLVMIHEFGHVFGLKHPFDEPQAGVNATAGDSPYLQPPEDNTQWTVMSYTQRQQDYAAYFKELDIAALQYQYGVSSSCRAGDSTYTLSESAPNFIYDGGGIDTIDASAVTKRVTLYLKSGYWGFVGDSRGTQTFTDQANGVGTNYGTFTTESITAAGQVTVNFGTSIENLKGSAFNDALMGNELNNSIEGGAGNDFINGGMGSDTLNGGAGDDLVVYVDATGGVTINLNNASQSNSSADGSDTLYLFEGVVGSLYNDTLTGDSSNNDLHGNAGNDTLTGGSGMDRFYFDLIDNPENLTNPNFPGDTVTRIHESATLTTGLDTITDFGLSDGDLLVLDTSIYAALSYPSTHDPQNKLSMNHSHEASLLQSEFLSGAGVSAAQSASQKILFNSTNGYLYYDADGSGASSTAIHFATIQNSGAAVAMTYDKIRLI